MTSRGLGRIMGGSAKKDRIPNIGTSLPHPTTLIDSATTRAKTLSHRYSAGDLAQSSKQSGLDRALKLIHPRTSKPSKAQLKIAPSGAIVFTPIRSQESLGSSILPAEFPAVPSTAPSIARPESTPIQQQVKAPVRRSNLQYMLISTAHPRHSQLATIELIRVYSIPAVKRPSSSHN